MSLNSDDAVTWGRTRRRVHQVLDVPEADDLTSKVINTTLIFLIIGNVLAVILESVAAVRTILGEFFFYFEIFSVIIFTVEYVLRLWASVEDSDPKYSGRFLGRCRYAMRPLVLIDLIVFWS